MQKITDYAELEPLIMSMLKPGVIANTSVTSAEYRREIADKGVFIQKTDSALLIFIKRDGYYKLNFFVKKGEKLPFIKADAPVVCEYATRTGADLPRENGALLFSRQRMKRMPQEVKNGLATVRVATKSDFDKIKSVMLENFNAMAGCIPTDSALLSDISDGLIYIAKEGGILHVRDVGKHTEIRHLAVDKDARKLGVAQSMFYKFITERPDTMCRVWVVIGNTPAIKFYEKNGFEPDGILTNVYIFEE